ncbi:MAG: hypothetical protein WBX07_10120 [Rhodoplanes sp.]
MTRITWRVYADTIMPSAHNDAVISKKAFPKTIVGSEYQRQRPRPKPDVISGLRMLRDNQGEKGATIRMRMAPGLADGGRA